MESLPWLITSRIRPRISWESRNVKLYIYIYIKSRNVVKRRKG